MHQGFHLNFQGYSHMRNMVMAELRNDLAAWRILLAAVRTGSIRETALQADLPAAKVSRIISELERELGFELLDRSTRPMKPTPSCRDLVEGMTPLLAGFDRMWEHFSKKEAMRHVSFAAPIDLCRLYFSALVAKWADAHPGITFDIRPEATADDVRNGLVDVAVINYVPLDATGLVLRRYNSSRTPLLATPEYIRAHGAPSSPEDLAQHTGLLLETVMHPPTQILKKNGAASPILRWKEVFTTHDQMTLRELVLSSLGITVDLYAGHVLPEIRRGRLVPIMPGWRREPWQMSVVTRGRTRRARRRSPTSPPTLRLRPRPPGRPSVKRPTVSSKKPSAAVSGPESTS